MYLVRVTPPMNFTFADDSLFLKKRFLAGDINSLNLLVYFDRRRIVLSMRVSMGFTDYQCLNLMFGYQLVNFEG